ncbi:MAG: PKD domain-containing protein [Chitinophagaceae bacterium]|nr:PKD domain-containing protein [Chitinophagaceae bacterium]
MACFYIFLLPTLSAQTGSSTFEFIENKGQWDSRVKYTGELASGSFFLQNKGFTVFLYHPDDIKIFSNHVHDETPANKKNKKIDYSKDLSGKVIDKNLSNPSGRTIRSHAYTVEFVGANDNPQIVPQKQVASYNNYFIGNDPSKWVSKARLFNAIEYKNIYPNVDLRYYSEDSKLKYDLIIHPGADPSKIVLKYTGADKLSIKDNNLIIKTSVGDVKELYPYSYQSDDVKGRKEVPCKFVVSSDNTVRFQVGAYSKNATLIIDPSLIFSSFTGSRSNQYGFTATPGPNGTLFSGGIVFGPNFPVTPGAFQEVYGNGGNDSHSATDIGIMQFSANGSQRLYATYIGGSDNEYPHSLFSDPAGNLVVMGRSYSGNYPTTRKIGVNGDCDLVVTRLTPDGTGITGSLKIGGSALDGVNIKDIQRSNDYLNNTTLIRNYGDDSRSEVILDGAGNIYVAAQTQSTNFPTKGAGVISTLAGGQDGAVLKINRTCTDVIWSTYLGGSGQDGAFVLDISPTTGNLYVAGGTTTSSSFPRISAGPTGSTYGGGQTDAFVSMLNSGNGNLLKSIYLGTGNVDIIYGIKFDESGFPYVMGVSRGGNWPVTNAIYSNPGSSQFVSKLSPDLTTFLYSTVFGSGSAKPNMSPVAFLVDQCENVYISGWGGWIRQGNMAQDPYDQAGVRGMPVTADAIKATTDNEDFYFICIQKNASNLLYGSFFGQSVGMYGEHVDGGTSRYDQRGVIYQAICGNCAGGAIFPTTPGVVGPVNGALPDGCNLAAVKIAFNFAGVAAGPRPTVNGVRDTLGCAPFTVVLEDTIRNAVSYIWSFDDGSPDEATTEDQVTHTFNDVGTYRIRLIAIDTNSCNERDTAYTTVRVGDKRANLSFVSQKLEPCEGLNYLFTNTSTVENGGRPFSDSSFVWDFGDGSLPIYAGPAPIRRPYRSPGIYNVKLYLVDTGYCNSPDSAVAQLFVSPLVEARFETPLAGCAPHEAIFTNVSLAGQRFVWNFGDESPESNDVNPVHLYENPGTYTISLTAYDSGTCNKVDDTTVTITVSTRPTAEFSYTPVTPIRNTPTIFSNLSTGGVRYKWLFGDGDSVVKTTRDTVLHQYNATGTYNACLITYNEFECTDTVCHDVQAEILPLLDVPNAFTPGRFGKNSIIRVEGFGIERMNWRIYNRWGQIVFQSNDRKVGWDGTFRGQPQPVDVYQYTLDVQFTDGNKTRKTGDITLIR